MRISIISSHQNNPQYRVGGGLPVEVSGLARAVLVGPEAGLVGQRVLHAELRVVARAAAAGRQRPRRLALQGRRAAAGRCFASLESYHSINS